MSLTGKPGRNFRGLILMVLLGVSFVFYFFDPGKLVIFPKCPLFIYTGLYCPGCGSQRAIHSFLHLRFGEVFHYNLMLLPAVILILYFYLRPFINRWLGINLPDILYHPKTPWVIFIVVIIFWILRNIPVAPFNWLAPV